MTAPEVPTPDYSDPREVYAFFGLAFYVAQVCEQGVVNLAVALNASKVGNVTSSMLDDLFAKEDGRTFGTVLNSVREVLGIPADLDADLKRVVQVRNQLAHSFFRDRSEQLFSETGRRKAIDDLIEIIKFIKQVDSRLDTVWQIAWSRYGVTRESLDAHIQEWRNSAQRVDQAPDNPP